MGPILAVSDGCATQCQLPTIQRSNDPREVARTNGVKGEPISLLARLPPSSPEVLPLDRWTVGPLGVVVYRIVIVSFRLLSVSRRWSWNPHVRAVVNASVSLVSPFP